MFFALGYLTGLITAILIVVVLMYFRRTIEHRTNIIEKQIANVGPRPKGMVIMPTEEIDDMREEIINKNSQEGRDTPISELR